jgi:hypothetical protein
MLWKGLILRYSQLFPRRIEENHVLLSFRRVCALVKLRSRHSRIQVVSYNTWTNLHIALRLYVSQINIVYNNKSLRNVVLSCLLVFVV